MKHVQPTHERRWFTSSYSSGNGACVEVAMSEQVSLRDSVHPDQTELTFAPEEWHAFVRDSKHL